MTRVRGLALLMLVASLAVAACGTGSSHHAGAENGDVSSGAEYDRAWIAGMIAHHEGAIEMAELAQVQAKTRFVRNLADDVIQTQSAEIALLREIDARLAAGGAEVGSLGVDSESTGMTHDLAELDGAENFDVRFMSMMVPHHDGAIAMNDALKQHGEDAELAALSARIALAQQREIKQMEKKLAIDPHEAVPPAGHKHDATD